jgi:4-hydroxy-3-methylbut-2-enyl diphosphate reductase
MKITLAPKIGFCFGVKRAVDITLDTIKKKPKPCQVLGPLVHNEFVIKELKKRGLKFINSLNEAKKGTIIIPAHGEDPKVLEKIKRRGYKIINTTCPLAIRAQNLAKELQDKGYQVVIIGDKNHKEVRSINAIIGGRGIIIGDEKEISSLKIKERNLGVMVQTTQNRERVEKILRKLKNKFGEIEFRNTLCPTVQSYQTEVKKLASMVDLMLIIGSKTSANTNKLAEVARFSKKPVYHIEDASQLKQSWFHSIKKVGIASGTSTPDWLIKDVVKRLKIIKA